MTTLETHPNATPAASSGGGALPGLQLATRQAFSRAGKLLAVTAPDGRWRDLLVRCRRAAGATRGEARAAWLATAVVVATGAGPILATEEQTRSALNAWGDQMTAAQAAREA